MAGTKKPHQLATGRALKSVFRADRHPENSAHSRPVARGAQIIRLPVFVDGCWVGNEFLRIGPGLRARIREMAQEGKR